jgi:uncharacterized membrane protein
MHTKIGWGLMTFLSLGIVLVASRYLTLDPEVFFPPQRAVYLSQTTGIVSHIVGGMLALGLGPFQFLRGLRTKQPALHRWIGRFYLLGILLGGTAGLYMATFAYTGPVAGFGFGALALLWLLTGALAYRSIRNGDVHTHRRWMIRNFALTFAAVTLRLQLPVLTTSFGFDLGYMIVAWSAWVPNLLLVEWFLNRRQWVVQRRPSTSSV